MEKSWNVMEFGFENCVGTLVGLYQLFLISKTETQSDPYEVHTDYLHYFL